MMAWSQGLHAVQHEQLLTLGPASLSPPFLTPSDRDGTEPGYAEIEQAKRRALRRVGHFPFAFRVPSNTLSLLARLRTEISVRFNSAAIAAALLPDIARACS